MHKIRWIACLVSLVFSASAVLAQVPIGGNISDGLGGPLLSGQTYVAQTPLTVPLGSTLTVQRGAIVKFNPGTGVSVFGTMVDFLPPNLPAGTRTILTSVGDDTAGQDTTPGQPTAGAAGDWNGLFFGAASDASILRATDIRFAGPGVAASVLLNDADITLDGVTITNGNGTALECGGGALPTATNCAFNNHRLPINLLAGQGIQRLTNCTATGNIEGNAVRAIGPAFPADGSAVSITTANTFNGNGVVVFLLPFILFPGVTGSIGPGVIIKSNLGNQVDFGDFLVCQGTPSAPVIFTSVADDAAGGDSLGDGPTSVAPGQWQSVIFRTATDGSTFDNVVVRGTGSTNLFGALLLEEADLTISNITLDGAGGAGLDLFSNSRPTVTNLAMSNVSGPAIDRCPWSAIPGFTNITATGTGPKVIRATTATINNPLTIAKSNTVNQNGAILWTQSISVSLSGTLSLGAGLILKPAASTLTFNVSGVLAAVGTAQDPIIMTSAADDASGGDSTGDGATVGAPGQWRGVSLGFSSGASTFEHVKFRFAGVSQLPCLQVSSPAGQAIRDCEFATSSGPGIDSGNQPIVVERSHFEGLLSTIVNATLPSISTFKKNTATNCTLGKTIRINSGPVGTQTVIRRENLLNDTFIANLGITIPVGSTLTLGPGVIVKIPALRSVSVSGTLISLGTGSEKVVFTSLSDDQVGDDATGDGPTTGVAGSWDRLRIETAGSANSVLDHVVVRFAGRLVQSSFQVFAPIQSMDGVAVEFGLGRGVNLDSPILSDIDNLLVHHCGFDGVRLASGSVNLVFATIANNTGVAIDDVNWTGKVISSIVFQNGGGAGPNLSAGDIESSNGFPIAVGMSGNIDQDPLFVDAANGDYSLSAGSPSIDGGSVVESDRLRSDHAGRSRASDATFSQNALPDMGAMERVPYTLDISREFRIGDSFTWSIPSGAPGFSFLLVGFGGSAYLPTLGWLNIGDPNTVAIVEQSSVGTPSTFPLVVPPSLAGFEFFLQAAGLSFANFPRGAFTEFVVARLIE